MLKPTKHKVERYEYEDFYVEIIDLGDMWEAWLRRKDYTISDMMFGWPKVQHPIYKPEGEYFTVEMFIDMVEENLPEYIECYNRDYQEEE